MGLILLQVPIQAPKPCIYCRQHLDDPKLKVFIGDPPNAASLNYNININSYLFV